ncbi:MAG: hypothetical protein M3Z66_02190, partial [Chloroflexota bacterium]|nr:hypothetical protein [Chloroflexota bacterium]
GWSWPTAHGMLVWNGHDPSVAVAPFSISHLRRYAVEAEITSLEPRFTPGDGTVTAAGFGIVVQEHTTPDSWYFLNYVQGLLAGFVSSPSAPGFRCIEAPQVPCTFDDAGLVWGPYGSSAGLTRFHPDRRPHLFRVDVDGTVYRLSIDGVQQGPPVRISGYSRYSRIGLWSLYYRIQVRSFRVIVLPSAEPGRAVDAGSLETKVLTGSDPVGKLTFNPHFMMNAEYAREYHLSAAAVERSGRLLSRSQGWGRPASVSVPLKPKGVFIVADSLTAYRTPGGSRWGLMNDVQADQATAMSGGGETPIELPQIGEESSGISFAAKDGNGRSLVVDVLRFREGSYEGHFTTIGYTDMTDSSAQRDGLLRVAQLVAGRISSNPMGTNAPRSFSSVIPTRAWAPAGFTTGIILAPAPSALPASPGWAGPERSVA